MTCLIHCPLGTREWKASCPERKSNSPRQLDSTVLELWLRFADSTILMWDLQFLWSGIKIAGGRSALGSADFGIFVKKVLSGGAADLDGKQRS